ncbi:hypothetical protein CGRA01v4_01839 [Colletotrichum graminicola]|nr:hypothetical protein CGRA01v4_01839 [Colletotrichum graminicola]
MPSIHTIQGPGPRPTRQEHCAPAVINTVNLQAYKKVGKMPSQALGKTSFRLTHDTRPASPRPLQISFHFFNSLTPELLSTAGLPPAGDESQRHNARDVHLRAEDLGVQTKFLSGGLHVLETLLVVGAGTTDPDLDFVLVELRGVVAEGANDTLECAGDVGEVGNTTTDEQNLARVVHGSAEHEVEDGAGVVVGLGLSGSTRVLSVVGELVGEASGGNSISVDDGSTATGDQSPDTAVGVEDSELERGTGLGVKVGNVGLLLGELTTEGSRELHRRAGVNVDLLAVGRRNVGQTKSGGRASNGPLDTTLEVGSLVELGSKIQEVHGGGGGILIGDDNEGVDLEVGELTLDVDGVQPADEVNQNIVDTLGDLLQQSRGDLVVGRVL